MAQFSLYRNRNPRSKSAYPLLLDVQSPLLDELGTRVVIPLCPAAALHGKPISRLCPTIVFSRKKYVLLTQQMAGIACAALGEPCASLEQQRSEIIAAIDFLITGV